MTDAAMFGPAMLGVTSGINAFQSFLPRLTEIRKASPQDNPDVAADVRLGEIAGVTLTLGIGVIASSLTGSPVPALTALVMCVIMVGVYESALRVEPIEKKRLRVVRENENA